MVTVVPELFWLLEFSCIEVLRLAGDLLEAFWRSADSNAAKFILLGTCSFKLLTLREGEASCDVSSLELDLTFGDDTL